MAISRRSTELAALALVLAAGATLALVAGATLASADPPRPTATTLPAPATTTTVPAPAAPAPLAASSIAVDDAAGAAMLARLAGQRARLVAGRLVIDDVAGEGRPWVGTIERRGAELWLVTDGGAVRLAGPLARPRVAGPGYRAWVTGAVIPGAPPTLRVRRLGILARP